jgi:hypothetical protein
METINFNVEDIPFKTKLKFTNGIFEFRFRYHKFSDRFYCDLYDNEGNIIIEDELIVYGIPLFWNYLQDSQGNLNRNYPDKWIIPLSVDGTEKTINLTNMRNKNVYLTLQDREDFTEEIDVILYENI